MFFARLKPLAYHVKSNLQLYFKSGGLILKFVDFKDDAFLTHHYIISYITHQTGITHITCLAPYKRASSHNGGRWGGG
jgi:hypothetical protein